MLVKVIKEGDYCLATKYPDGDPLDHWVIGFYKGVLPKIGDDRFEIVDENGKSFR